ncbi:GNAT family N-acetyltransferase [Leifsonia xyli]|uniref:GNAT family N-acetyltransferase n=1 Tax=Leifsonia xyli TaxID=1575 RepID=UPI003D66484C
MSDTVVGPADEAVWRDLQTVFSTRGDPAGCWCQWFKLPGPRFKELSVEQRRERLHDQTRAEAPGAAAPGVIAWVDDQPAGWAAVEPYSAYPNLARSPITKRVEGDPPDPWAVTCFVVRVDFRQRGVARSLLHGAVEHARAHGADVLEGYPVDPEVRPSLSNAERYHGTVSLFRDGGFEVVRRPSATRAIMRRTL